MRSASAVASVVAGGPLAEVAAQDLASETCGTAGADGWGSGAREQFGPWQGRRTGCRSKF